jgi:hypothetical protein
MYLQFVCVTDKNVIHVCSEATTNATLSEYFCNIVTYYCMLRSIDSVFSLH